MLAHYLHNLSPFIVEFQNGFGLRWYGLSYVLSFLLAYLLYKWLAVRGYTDLPPRQVGDFITWAAVFGVMLGGRLGWILFYLIPQEGWRELAQNPAQLFKVWEGGMASHGGIIGLVLFTFYWSRKHKVSWTSIGDCLVVVSSVGLFLVRIANFINGELYGRVTQVRWAMLFPAEIYENPRMQELMGVNETHSASALIAGARHDPELAARLREILSPRHPSQLYEAALEGLLLFVILWIMRTRFRLPRGVITGAFFILYAMLRIVGEAFREPDRAWHIGAISAGQFLSIFMIFIGAAFVWHGCRRQEYERVFAEPSNA